MSITKQQRKEVENKVYNFMDTIDPSKINSDYYRKLFHRLSDKEFEELFKKEFPLRFHYRPFENDIPFSNIIKANRGLGVETFEKINQPHVYVNANGIPVKTVEKCLVGYMPVQKMKQFITKKNSMSTNIDMRNMKNGMLMFEDKNGKESDKEIESLVISNLDVTAVEFSRPKADSLIAKRQMYNSIKSKGSVELNDLELEKEDSLSKNLFNAYLIGSHIKSNLVGEGYMLPKTVKIKGMKNKKQI